MLSDFLNAVQLFWMHEKMTKVPFNKENKSNKMNTMQKETISSSERGDTLLVIFFLFQLISNSLAMTGVTRGNGKFYFF